MGFPARHYKRPNAIVYAGGVGAELRLKDSDKRHTAIIEGARGDVSLMSEGFKKHFCVTLSASDLDRIFKEGIKGAVNYFSNEPGAASLSKAQKALVSKRYLTGAEIREIVEG